VAVEAEARLQAQRIAGAEADGLHAVLRQQQPRQRLRVLRRNRDLKAVLARIARAADVAVEAADTHARRRHECEAGCRRREPRHRRLGGRTLQGNERTFRCRQQHHRGREAARDVRVVHLLARGIDHQEQPAVVIRRGRPSDHQVVDDAARIVEELGVALLAGLEPQDIGRHQCLQRGGCGCMVGPDQERLPHVRDVEQAGLGPRVLVLPEDAQRVLDGHLVAGERHHLGAQRHVQRVKRRAVERLVGSRVGAHLSHVPQGLHPAPDERGFKPPLSRDLRDFGGEPALPLR
jgi:hypothetical protein